MGNARFLSTLIVVNVTLGVKESHNIDLIFLASPGLILNIIPAISRPIHTITVIY
jgi:hypothetical protein